MQQLDIIILFQLPLCLIYKEYFVATEPQIFLYIQIITKEKIEMPYLEWIFKIGTEVKPGSLSHVNA